MKKEELHTLASKILDQTATEEEVAYYIRWFDAAQDKVSSAVPDAEEKKAAIYAAIRREISPAVHKLSRWPLKVAAAALLLITLSFATYFIFRSDTPKRAAYWVVHDVRPGGEKAVLTLSSGKSIVLNVIKTGDVVADKGTMITKNSSGVITYHQSGAISAEQGYNTIATPRGGNFEVILPDGTRVLLNAASSLKYPVTFKENERSVELTGEAYFEVAKDRTRPFFVLTSHQSVRVLGTHFNINAYEDEQATTTTLVEGSVRVESGGASVLLKPGGQSRCNHNGKTLLTMNPDADRDEAIAWKNNLFNFNNTDIAAMMRQISRWYDVEIVYQGPVPQDKFTGTLSKKVNLSNTLKLLQFTGIKFNIEGRKVMIN